MNELIASRVTGVRTLGFDDHSNSFGQLRPHLHNSAGVSLIDFVRSLKPNYRVVFVTLLGVMRPWPLPWPSRSRLKLEACRSLLSPPLGSSLSAIGLPTSSCSCTRALTGTWLPTGRQATEFVIFASAGSQASTSNDTEKFTSSITARLARPRIASTTVAARSGNSFRHHCHIGGDRLMGFSYRMTAGRRHDVSIPWCFADVAGAQGRERLHDGRLLRYPTWRRSAFGDGEYLRRRRVQSPFVAPLGARAFVHAP